MYAKITDNTVSKFPYSVGELHKDNPDTSFPESPSVEILESFGVYEVAQVDAPTIDSRTHRHTQTVQQREGVWTQVWDVQQLAKDKAAANMRGVRLQKLTACDWTQVIDAPVDQVAWAVYRQALRDITVQAGFPWTITWPEEPK